MGGEPTFVSVDDLESPEWNIAAVGPTKRALADELIRKAARAFCARRTAALRAGQMVSGRKPAALGVRALLAQGRRADLEERRPDCEHRKSAQSGNHRRRTLCRRYRARSSDSIPNTCCRRSKIPRIGCEGSRPAGKCRSQRFQIVRSGRALADGAGVRSRAQHAQRFCAADPALERGRQAASRTLAQRTLEGQARQSVSFSRRFPAWPAAADRLAGAHSAGGIPLHRRAGSDGAARRTGCFRQGRRSGEDSEDKGQEAKTRARAHGDVDRNPRRCACAPSCRRSRSWKIIWN